MRVMVYADNVYANVKTPSNVTDKVSDIKHRHKESIQQPGSPPASQPAAGSRQQQPAVSSQDRGATRRDAQSMPM